jgi:preprotein translocase subunit YajC
MYPKTPFEPVRQSVQQLSTKGSSKINGFLLKNPKAVFAGMVMCVILSIFIVFFVLPPQQKAHSKDPFQEFKSLGNGIWQDMSGLLRIGESVYRISQLKEEVERIMEQGEISGSDSLFLEMAIEAMENYNPAKPKKP